ncbi:MAG: putative Flavin-containing amine oxidase [Acidimicrobiales bacterium]|nr:putative Flavin-containing amine oxidase [Acidimicrobiales bacterium]
MVCAHELQATHPEHELTVFEADDRVGGHANTVRVDLADETHHVDTGFIVYNDRNYPVFSRLLADLGVATQPSDMSLAVQDERSGLEWGTNRRRLFADRRNALRPGFVSMVAEILRWNRLGTRLLAAPATGDRPEPVGHFLARHHFSRRFLAGYLTPLAAAIWSADPSTIAAFPVVTMCRFLQNHGMLSLGDQPAWRTITGGSRSYVDALTAGFADRIRTGTAVDKVQRHGGGIDVVHAGGIETFDRVVMALHSDQALDLLADADRLERDVIGAIRYQPNVATLHTDRRMLPRLERTWASWNVQVRPAPQSAVTMTYHMNRLQALVSRHELCVTLNRHDDIDPASILARFDYAHPVFDEDAVRAQRRRHELQGRGGLFWCGAYWGYGFHEDGARSGVDVAHLIGAGR